MAQFREHEERHISSEIKLMKWNPKFDLIAVAFKSGDVALHRLVGWQKVWHLACPGPEIQKFDNNQKKHFPGVFLANANLSKNESTSSTCNEHGISVNAIDWRPDGKVLAIGYNKNANKLSTKNYIGSKVCLVDVENGQVFENLEIDEGEVSCLSWDEFYNNESEINMLYNWSSPNAIEFLPKMVPIEKSYEDKNETPNYFGATQQPPRKILITKYEDTLKVSNQKTLNMLAVGTNNGFVQIYLFGVYKCGSLKDKNGSNVANIFFSGNLAYMNVTFEKLENNYSIIAYDITCLKKNHIQHFIVADIYCKIKSLIQYLNESIKAMYETWEEILLEIDNKLANYILKSSKATNKANKDVLLADEFLELLVFGNVTDTLEKFLHSFSEKGLKKLGQSIESTYANMQKLIVINLQRVIQHIFSYFQTFRAISMWKMEFEELGLDTKYINECLKCVGSFYLKTIEFQQVIDISIRNVKCFFKWLYSVMLRVYGDSVPPSQQEQTKISQQDLQFVADFIQENFENEDEQANVPNDSSDCFEFSTTSKHEKEEDRPTSSNFTLERVGQYLKDEKLSYISPLLNDLSTNPWINYINSHNSNSHSNNILFYPHHNEKSLIQEYKILEQSFHQIYKSSVSKISSQITGKKSEINNIMPFINEVTLVPQFDTISDNFGYIFSPQIFCLIQYDFEYQKIKYIGMQFCMGEEKDIVDILDFEFYSDTALSFLLYNPANQNSYLFQFAFESYLSDHQLLEASFFFKVKDISANNNFVSIHIKDDIVMDNENEPIMQLRKLENIRVCSIAVSGSRKVSCVSSVSRRRIRIFEMDTCEDDDQVDELDTLLSEQFSLSNLQSSSSF